MTTTGWVAFGCVLEWSLIHLMSGVAVGLPALRGDVTGVYNVLFGFTNDDEHWKRLQQEGSSNQPNNQGWPFMCSRIHLQHGINLWNVGMQTMIATWMIYTGHR